MYSQWATLGWLLYEHSIHFIHVHVSGALLWVSIIMWLYVYTVYLMQKKNYYTASLLGNIIIKLYMYILGFPIVLYSKAIINLSKPTASRLVKVRSNLMCIFDMRNVVTCGCWL